MTLAQLETKLKNISGFEKKVAYRAFPVGKAPALPFICYLCTQTDNFVADNKVHTVLQSVDIELYSALKDTASETKIETLLNNNNIVWDKYEEYITDENTYEVIYTIPINQ